MGQGGRPTWLAQRSSCERRLTGLDFSRKKSISQCIHFSSQWLRLADFTGDWKADVAKIHETNGAIDLYINQGSADTSVAGDGIRFC